MILVTFVRTKVLTKVKPSVSYSSVLNRPTEKTSLNEVVISYLTEIIKLIDIPEKEKLTKLIDKISALIKNV